MKSKKIYEGKNYKLKKNSINKIKNRYSTTYQYIITNIFRYKKYINQFNTIIIKNNNKDNINNVLLKIIESTAKDFSIDNNKIYSYNKLNKELMKKFNKIRKEEKKNNIETNNKVIKLYKQIEKKEYKQLRELALKKPKLFLEAVYMYTICED